MPLISRVGRKKLQVRFVFWGIAGVLWIGVMIHLFPIWWMFTTSIKTPEEIFTLPPTLWPKKIDFFAYRLIFQGIGFGMGGLKYPIWVYVKNSFIITGGYIFLHVPVTALAAYANSKLQRPKIARMLFLFFIGTLMVPGELTIISRYLLLYNFPFALKKSLPIPFTNLSLPSLNMVNTYYALIVPGMFGAFHFLLFKGFFDTIPDSIIHAARVDGASELSIFRRIILPMSTPIFAVVGYFAFTAIWNNFMGPLILLKSERLYPLSLALYRFQQSIEGQGGMGGVPTAEIVELGVPIELARALSWNGLMVISFIESLPVFIMFIIFREYIMKGIRLRGLK